MDTLGMIAGNGVYPATMAAGARSAGVRRLVVAAFEDETDPALADQVDRIEWFRVGQLSKLIRYFRAEGVTEAVMAGQIAPKNLFELRPDLRTLMMLGRLKVRQAETLFAAIADELAKDGITLLPATTFLDHLLPAAGHVAGPALTKRQREDAERAMITARRIAAMDIGQTIVVRHGTVLAVEAFEGTNECIKRGGALGRGEAMTIKVSKPGQDFRFDVPVIGATTIRTAAESGIKAIIIEAGRTLLLEDDGIRDLCAKHGIAVEAMAATEPQPEESTS